jgi:hypothetical protein
MYLSPWLQSVLFLTVFSGSWSFSLNQVFPRLLPREINHQPDSETLASFATSGGCMSYVPIGSHPNDTKMYQPCIAWCGQNSSEAVGVSCSTHGIVGLQASLTIILSA